MLTKFKLKLFSIALVAIVMTLATQGTLAYYTVAARATNVVTMNGVKLKIHEKTNQGTNFPAEGIYIMPGDVVSKKVSIQNVCEEPFYLRVKMVYGVDAQPLSNEDCFKLNIDTENWKLVDGWYYYKEALSPEDTTSEVFTKVEIVGSQVDNRYLGKTLSITVIAQAVQEKNNPIINNDTSTASGWPAN